MKEGRTDLETHIIIGYQILGRTHGSNHSNPCGVMITYSMAVGRLYMIRLFRDVYSCRQSFNQLIDVLIA